MKKTQLTKKDLSDAVVFLRRVVAYGTEQDRLVGLVDKIQRVIDHKEDK